MYSSLDVDVIDIPRLPNDVALHGKVWGEQCVAVGENQKRIEDTISQCKAVELRAKR